MTDKQNPWAGPDGEKAIEKMARYGLLDRLPAIVAVFEKAATGVPMHVWERVLELKSIVEIQAFRDAARVFMDKHKMGYGKSRYATKNPFWYDDGVSESFDTADERDIAGVLAIEEGKGK